jgi:hypothetical protein
MASLPIRSKIPILHARKPRELTPNGDSRTTEQELRKTLRARREYPQIVDSRQLSLPRRRLPQVWPLRAARLPCFRAERDGELQQRIMAQTIEVIAVLLAAGDGEGARRDQLDHVVPDMTLAAPIGHGGYLDGLDRVPAAGGARRESGR